MVRDGEMEIIPECSLGEDELRIRIGLKKAASDGSEYSTEEAEEKDLNYLIENSCMVCGRLLEKHEVKILPPQYMLDRDQYVASGVVSRRYICTTCYTMITSSSRERLRSSYKGLKTASKSIVNSFVASMMQKRT